MAYTKPRYVLFAGVNGSGKSTLYQLLPEYQNLPRINTDEIVQEYGDWKDFSSQMKAGRKAVELLKSYFESRISFNQETTLCGRSILRNIENARNLGYQVEIHYLGVDSVEICKERIRHRVSAGGHGIPDRDVERRYSESLRNIKKVLPLCSRVYFYDNTESFALTAISKYGEIDLRCPVPPEWLKMIL